MFRRASSQTLKHQYRVRRSHRCYTTSFREDSLKHTSASRNVALAIASIGVFTGLYLHARKTIRNDSSITPLSEAGKRSAQNVAQNLASSSATGRDELTTVAWGSNKYNLLSSGGDTLKNGGTMNWLNNIALRDLALHELYGICVDVQGDVYQWTGEGAPKLVLEGKNIQNVQLTPSRVFAISTSGKIYSFPSENTTELSATEKNNHNNSTSSSWYFWNWFSSSDPKSIFTELSTEAKLDRREKFVSISAGTDHLLALTSTGRTFVHPITSNANAYGQLASRRFRIPTASAESSDGDFELVPKIVQDPYVNVSRFARSSTADLNSSSVKIAEIEGKPFCDKLFEVQSLKGIRISQAVAGARSSYVRTAEEGRVLAWGANEFGQLGLGSSINLEAVTVPTEVVLSRYTQSGTQSRCINIITGGDLTFFMVERIDGTTIPAVDILACGMGQWGGLGNGLFSTAQGTPSRVKNVSGLVEFSDETRNLQAIIPYAMSVSPTGHVLLTMDTLLRSGSESINHGRDLYVWGQNKEYQLGTGKKTSIAAPTSIDTPAAEGSFGAEGLRAMLRKKKAGGVRDLQGRLWKRNVEVEQTARAGYGCSVVYWKIC